MRRRCSLFLVATALLALATGINALELEDCRISAGPSFPSLKARCGTLLRQENPDDPDSPQLELRLAVVAALNLQPEPDPVVPIAGGPGQGTIEFYSAYAGAFEELRRNRDILLLDQRGTGDSARMDCPVEDNMLEGAFSTAETIRYTEECLDQLPYDPRFFTTSVAVADLEAARVALGYPALNLYGISYGSRVAQHFARRYPDVTRTLILDGVVPPQLSLGPEIATEAQHALERIFARCAEDDACAERFGDLEEKFAGLKTRLSEKKVRVKAADPVTGEFDSIEFGADEMAIALRLLAYDARTIALVPLLVSEAADGNYRPLLAQFQMTLTSLADAIAMGMHNAVMCSEDVPFYDDTRFDTAAIENSYIGPVQLESLQAICSVWPAGPVDADFKQPLATDTPTLLLSGDADPITPPRYADLAASNLKRAWLMTGKDQGHGQVSVGCMPRLVGNFVANRGFAEVDTGCIENSFVMPFFLDYSGPAP